jgi:ComF family protein
VNQIPWSYRVRQLAWSGLDVIFPPVCGGCGKLGWRWCQECQKRTPRIHDPVCERCGIPTTGQNICELCKKEPPAYRKMRSWAVFDSPIQNGLHTMKYKGNLPFGEALALQMTEFVNSLHWDIDLLIPVPLGRKRLQERGYNQVALVAQPLAYRTGICYLPQALWKTRETRTQVGLNGSQRQKNVLNAFRADARSVARKSILLMDDVSTTGSTISACTEALLSAGAREVYGITVARALARHDMSRV